MSQIKEFDTKCSLCGTREWIEREGEDGKAMICNMCGLYLAKISNTNIINPKPCNYLIIRI
jgi:hypothetical protein